MPHQPGDSLFFDPKYLRGDLRGLRAAIRRGWLDGATQEHRDALVKAFQDRVHADEFMDNPGLTYNAGFRRLIAACRLIVTMEEENLRDRSDAVDALLGIRRRGRPRKRRRSLDLQAIMEDMPHAGESTVTNGG